KAGAEAPDPELVELCAAHDRILAEAGSLDRGDLFLVLNKLLAENTHVRHAIGGCFSHLLVDELEGTSAPPRAILAELARDNQNHLYALEEGETDPASAWFHSVHPDGEVIRLDAQLREPATRFWRCSNERAQAQAVTREIEHLLATGTSPEGI